MSSCEQPEYQTEDAPNCEGVASDKSEYVHRVFSKIAPNYDLMNDIESLGLHRLWKAKMVQELSQDKPKQLLDIACGTGDISIALAKENPGSQVTGLDFCEDMLKVARSRAPHELPLSFVIESVGDESGKSTSGTAYEPTQSNAPSTPCIGQHASVRNKLSFIQGDAMALPFSENTFDAVSISFGLRNMPDYGAVLAEILRVLKPGGRFCCLEASYPTNPLIKPPFKLYFKHWLPVLGKLVVNSPDEYSWLNTSTEAFLNKDELAKLMQKTGFAQVSYTSFLFGAAALHRGTKEH